MHLAELAWHIGNRHLAAAIEAERILILRDHVIRAMLEGLGAVGRRGRRAVQAGARRLFRRTATAIGTFTSMAMSTITGITTARPDTIA